MFLQNRLKRAAQQNIDRTARSYSLSQLIDNSDSYYPKSASEEEKTSDTGLIYATSVITAPNAVILSRLQGNFGDVERGIKKLFQERSRIVFYMFLQDLKIGRKNPADLRDNYLSELIANNEKLSNKKYDLKPDTIEYHVQRLIDAGDARSEEKNLFLLGTAVRKGALAYHDELKISSREGDAKFKLFLEYNRILTSLKEV